MGMAQFNTSSTVLQFELYLWHLALCSPGPWQLWGWFLSVGSLHKVVELCWPLLAWSQLASMELPALQCYPSWAINLLLVIPIYFNRSTSYNYESDFAWKYALLLQGVRVILCSIVPSWQQDPASIPPSGFFSVSVRIPWACGNRKPGLVTVSCLYLACFSQPTQFW